MGDAAHFVFGIGHDVIALAAAIGSLAHAFLAKIDVAVELADDQQVDLPGNFRAQRGQVFQPGKQLGRAQIGEQAQLLAQAEDRLLGAQMAFEMVAIEIADRAEQDGVAGAGNVQRGWRERVAMLAVSRRADIAVDQLQPIQAKRLQYTHRFARDFRANSVAGKNRNFHRNSYPSILANRSRSMARAAITSLCRSASG